MNKKQSKPPFKNNTSSSAEDMMFSIQPRIIRVKCQYMGLNSVKKPDTIFPTQSSSVRTANQTYEQL